MVLRCCFSAIGIEFIRSLRRSEDQPFICRQWEIATNEIGAMMVMLREEDGNR